MAHRVRFASLLGLIPAFASLAACGGSGKPNTPPVASFAVASPTVAAGSPLLVDATPSSDPDGDALTYAWSFGNGRRGGGATIATVFATAGTFEITLTVDDGRGGSHSAKQSVTVTAGPEAMGTVEASVLVRDTKGNRLGGVSVNVVGGAGTPAATDDDGRGTLTVGRGVPVSLSFKKVGFADQLKTLALPVAAESGYLEVTMLAREAAATLASAAKGGAVEGKDGAKVTFPANALVDADGKPVTGPVQVAITPVDVAKDVRAFPGRFEGLRSNGQQGLIVSYGTAEFVVTAAGAPVQLAPGKKAVIELPIYTTLNLDGSPVTPGAKFPVWSLDEVTGAWIEEGTGVVVAVDGGDELALRADVTHLSWWNHDQFNDPPGKPKPRCLVDTNHDGVLEDLTGTGYCFHEATPNPIPTSTFDEGDGAETAAAGEQRIPAFAATASTPVGGGVVLPIPADVDVVFRSWAMNGTLFGMKVIKLGPGVEADVDIVLQPVKDAPASTTITLPFEDAFLMGAPGETDKFVFAAEAGSTYEVKVTREGGSLLSGLVRVVRSTGQQLVAGNISAAGYLGTATATVAGNLTVEIVGDASAPGSYEIAVRKVVNTTCGAPQALAVPSTTATSPLPASGAACFTLDLAADDVVRIKNTQQSGAKGTISLIAPTGEELALDTYGTGSFDGMLLDVAVVQAGTYRLQIVNTNATKGSVAGLSVAKLVPTATLDVPGMDTFAGPASDDNERIFVVKKPAGTGDLAVRLDANQIGHGFTVSPARVNAQTGDATVRVVRTSPLVRPLITVFRMSASTAWDYKLSVTTPVDLALDTDVAVTAPTPFSLIAYRFEGVGGQELSAGVQEAMGAEVGPSVKYVYDPQGATVVPAAGRIYKLPETGVYTIELATTGMGAFTARLNKLPAPEALTLGPAVPKTGTLALGEVKRYAFTVTQAQVLGLGLSSTTTLQVGASIAGGDIYNGGVALPRGPGSAASRAMYVHKTAAATLSVSSQSRTVGEASGPFTLTVYAPTPTPTTLGAGLSTTLTAGVPVTYGYTIATAGRHLLCYDYVGLNDSSGLSRVDAIVWGPSAPFVNYTGDLNGQGSGNRVEVIDSLRVGANTLSLATDLASAATRARLIALKDATPLTVGSAANGTLTECQRGYHTFAGMAGQAYTVKVTGAFAGEVRVHKLLGTDPSTRNDPPFGAGNLGGTPLALTANVERAVTFTIGAAAPFGTGTYVVDVDATDEATGAYSVIVTSP